MNTYTTTAGTEPDASQTHEARTLTHVDELYMMSEIGDGVFVAWTRCRHCASPVASCACSGGPVEPPHITRWRLERFDKSLTSRVPGRATPAVLPPEHADHVPTVVTAAVDDGIDKALAAVQQASEEDSNDDDTATN